MSRDFALTQLVFVCVMARPNIDTIEIVEPPIGELTRRGGGFKKGCFTGCLFFIILIIGSIVGIKVYLGKGPAAIKTLPEGFPTSIPLYDRDNVERITYIPGQYKSRAMRIAAFFPRVLFSPLISEQGSSAPLSRRSIAETWRILTSPVTDDARSTLQVEWTNMDASGEFVITYYITELQKYDFEVSREPYSSEIDFSKDDITGTLIVHDEDEKPGVEYGILTVNY